MANLALQNENDLDCSPQRTFAANKPKESILLIEDSEEAMWLVRYALDEYGGGRYRLQWAHDLRSGLTQLMDGGVDLVLLDLGLPDSNGPESFAWLREVCPNVPVVVLTGNESEETEFAVTASGVEGYVTKDQVSGLLLLQKIRAALYSRVLRKGRASMACRLLTPRFRID